MLGGEGGSGVGLRSGHRIGGRHVPVSAMVFETGNRNLKDPMRALVTGGAGYFGELLVRKLIEGGFSVRIFDLNRPEQPIPGVEIVQGDIRDTAAITAACAGVDVVFHNVAQVPLAKDRGLFWSVNRDGTENMLRWCSQQKAGTSTNSCMPTISRMPASWPAGARAPRRTTAARKNSAPCARRWNTCAASPAPDRACALFPWRPSSRLWESPRAWDSRRSARTMR